MEIIKMRKTIRLTLIGVFLIAVLATVAYAAFYVTFQPDRTVIYRQVDGVDLSIALFGLGKDATTPRPAILFYHGGAWTVGSPVQFYPWAKHFAELGWVAASAQYRLNGRHGTDVFDAVEDGRAAYLYLQQHAAELGIDPQRILLSGGSAGGHLAATVAMTPWLERNTVPGPEALVLLNPALNTVYDDTEAIAHLFAGKGEQISPTHHVQPGLPPTIIVHGTEDSLVPITDSREFCLRMKKANNQCEVVEYEGVGHGFFNWGGGHFDEVLAEVVNFTQDF
jgi:acetyl esterase